VKPIRQQDYANTMFSFYPADFHLHCAAPGAGDGIAADLGAPASEAA
jgi:hypothetical protein